MKTKITLILAFLAASAFAFAAEVPAENNAPATAPEKAQVCPKGRPAKPLKARPHATPEQRLAFIRHMLLTRSDEELTQFANELEAVRKMTAEEKAEALKALPKPEFARRPIAPDGKPAARPAPRGEKPGCGAKGVAPRAPRGPKGCCCASKGAPLPPPPAPEADAPEADDAPDAPVEE